MPNYHVWLLDLNDTLQIGPLSWAARNLFPQLIAETGLKPDRVTFEAALAHAEMLYAAGNSNDVLGEEFFRRVGWSLELKTAIYERFEREYRPALFEDTVPFLDWLRARGDRIYMTANGNWTRQVCKMLGITDYFDEIVTPIDNGVARKPSPEMWHYLKAHTDLTEASGVVVVGNNTINDGEFARSSGIDCLIVDRYDRFDVMPEGCVRVTSLYEIMATLDGAG